MTIEVLGTDGTTCKSRYHAALEVIRLSGKMGRGVIVDNKKKLVRYGVSAPAIAINGAVVFCGTNLRPEEIVYLLLQNV